MEFFVDVRVRDVAVFARSNQVDCELGSLGLAFGSADARWHGLTTDLTTWAFVDHDCLSAHLAWS